MNYYNQLKQQIESEIDQKGYRDKLITYEEFQELYRGYEKEITELQFANLLGITESNYKTLKNRGTRARILRKREGIISEERKEEIVNEVDQKGYRDKLITYEEFKELYRDYENEMTEGQFANLLEVTDSNCVTARNKGTRIRILKKREGIISKERKKEIVNEVDQKGYRDKLITYEEFQELYKDYEKEMTEVQFANILGVKESNYNNLKNAGTRTRILKKREEIVSEERQEEIVSEIDKKGYGDKLVTYEEFQELYRDYEQEITEVQFANILRVRYSSYNNLKNRGTRTRILKKREEAISKERQEEIKNEIDQKGYRNKLITYEEFQELYKDYGKEMTEVQFASILGVKEGNYRNAKCTGQKIRILKKGTGIISEERQEEIVSEIDKKGYGDKLVTYEEFQELYRDYEQEMTEVQFANILGVKEGNYWSARGKESRIRISFEQNQIDILKHLLQESRYYDKEELEQICIKVGITFEKAILVISNYNEEVANEKKKLIIENNRLYIGNGPISNEFLNKYIEEIFSYCKDVSNKLGIKYRLTRLSEDIASDVLLNIIQKRVDITNNYTNEEAVQILKIVCYTNMKCRYIKSLRIRVPLSIDGKSDDPDKAYITEKWKRDKKTNVEQTAIKNYERQQNIQIVNITNEEELYQVCISVINECHEEGMNHTEYIYEVCKRTGIDYNKLLEIMKKYLMEKNRVRQTKDGKYIQGEEK